MEVGGSAPEDEPEDERSRGTSLLLGQKPIAAGGMAQGKPLKGNKIFLWVVPR